MNFFSSLRGRLVLLIIVTLLPVMGLLSYQASEQKRLAVSDALRSADLLARDAAAAEVRLMDGVRQFLFTVSQLPEVYGQDRQSCRTLFAALVRRYPPYFNMGLIDLNGRVVASARPLPPGFQPARLRFFQDVLKGDGLSFADFETDAATKKPIIRLGYPVFDADRKLQSVLFLSLDLDWMSRFLESMRKTDTAALFLMDRSGLVLARAPDAQTWVGKTPSGDFVRRMLRTPRGTIEAEGFDRVRRIYTYAPIMIFSDNELILAAGISKETALAPASAVFRKSLFGLALVSFLSLLAAWFGSSWFILRRVNVLLAATKRLSYGSGYEHTGLEGDEDELGQLALAFDEMAMSLKRREKELLESDRRATEARFAGLLEIAADAIITTDASQNIRLFNRGAEKIFGYTAAEMAGRPLTALMPDKYAEVYSQYVHDFMRTPQGAEAILERVELVGRRKDGSQFPIEASISKTGEGAGGSFTAVLRDITKRKSAEKEIRQLNERFQSLINHANNAIVTIDASSRVTLWNPAAEATFGYRAAEVMGRDVAKLIIPEEFRERHYMGIRRLIETGKGPFLNRSVQIDAQRADGSLFPVELSLFQSASGEKTEFTAIIRDITDRRRKDEALRRAHEELERRVEERTVELARAVEEHKRTAEALAHSNRELEQFAYVASHDLQEPLRKIIAFSDRLIERPITTIGDVEKDYFRRMQNAGLRMKNLIEDLLNFSRVTSVARQPEIVDLGAVVREVLKDLDMRIIQKKAHIEVAGPLPSVHCNSVQVRQLFQNIIGNALKFSKTDEPARIRIEGRDAGDGMTEVSIADNGIGFDEKYVDRIFKPFQRLHSREEYEGTGIGLAICQKIAQRCGGRLWARSTPGGGSTFFFTLPRA